MKDYARHPGAEGRLAALRPTVLAPVGTCVVEGDYRMEVCLWWDLLSDHFSTEDLPMADCAVMRRFEGNPSAATTPPHPKLFATVFGDPNTACGVYLPSGGFDSEPRPVGSGSSFFGWTSGFSMRLEDSPSLNDHALTAAFYGGLPAVCANLRSFNQEVRVCRYRLDRRILTLAGHPAHGEVILYHGPRAEVRTTLSRPVFNELFEEVVVRG